MAHARSLVLDKHSGADAYSIIEGFLQVTEIGSLKKFLKKRAAGGAGNTNSRWIMRATRDGSGSGQASGHSAQSSHSAQSAVSFSASTHGPRRDAPAAPATQVGRGGPGDVDVVAGDVDGDEGRAYQAQSYQSGGLGPGATLRSPVDSPRPSPYLTPYLMSRTAGRADQVRHWPAWKYVSRAEGPSPPDTPTLPSHVWTRCAVGPPGRDRDPRVGH